MIDVVEIIKHWYAGRNLSEIARGLGLDRKTVRKYVAAPEREGISPGGPPLSSEEWGRRIKVWFPELTDPRARSSVLKRLMPLERSRRTRSIHLD